MGSKPTPSESVVEFDRANPVLGNRHILKNFKDAVERDRVIAAYRADLEADWAKKGPMYRDIVKLAERVVKGEQIAGRCWCEPKPCHGEIIIEKVKALVKEMQPDHPWVKAAPIPHPAKPIQQGFGF